MSLLSQLRPGDRATIVTPHGQERSGRVVMKFASHAVLNLGGKHGTPGIATEANLVRVKLAPRAKPLPVPEVTEAAPEVSGLHTIGYAYRFSPVAERLGFPGSGCYFAHDTDFPAKGFATYAEALAYVKTLGTKPSRWSMDQPLDALLLPAEAAGGAL